MPTLEQAVSFATDNCGRYGEGSAINDWKLAVKKYEQWRMLESAGKAATVEATPAVISPDQLDWTKLGLNLGAVKAKQSPPYDRKGQRVQLATMRGLEKENSLPLGALQAISVAAKAVAAAAEPKSVATKTSTNQAKPKLVKTLEVKAEKEEKSAPLPLASSTQVATASTWPFTQLEAITAKATVVEDAEKVNTEVVMPEEEEVDTVDTLLDMEEADTAVFILEEEEDASVTLVPLDQPTITYEDMAAHIKESKILSAVGINDQRVSFTQFTQAFECMFKS
ncbi:putative polyprotein [Phytophthora cinnamomi]|uniref:putative polyprotein n=1 Tax=Phytophthora cinnamomi TaxID=4785 RepID=UPI003559F457|nr:putative polyprotein [Phytophthora cinnamomi]